MSGNISIDINQTDDNDDAVYYPLEVVVPLTVIYGIIFITGVIGNVATCIVISKNKSMHTATNYYLFSLAVSDFLLLISGLPPEMYRTWSPNNYVFGQVFCVLQGFAAETSANATVLTITAFTVERYVAICHPFLSHTMSKLSRAIKFIIGIWLIALGLAAPQAIQFGIEITLTRGVQITKCTVVSQYFQHAFEISTFLFFVGPMTLITILYVLIGIQLRKSTRLTLSKRESLGSSGSGRNSGAQKRVVKMLVAVVAAFFFCWAPFHAQRVLAIYLLNASKEAQHMAVPVYLVLMHVSGVLYFLSTTINPVLYNIMSNKFREAFKKTLSDFCRSNNRQLNLSQNYTVLSRYPLPNKNRHHQKASFDATTEENNDQISTKIDSITKSTTKCANLESSKIASSDPSSNIDAIRSRMLNLFNKNQDARGQFTRQTSVESNTISNSSLQDVEEIDYSSSDLFRYMEEINGEII